MEHASTCGALSSPCAAEAAGLAWLDLTESERQARLRELEDRAEELACRHYNRQCEGERRRLLELERRALEREDSGC